MPSNSSGRVRARRPAQSATSARRSVEDDRNRRMWQYLIAMGIRTAAFPVAVWAFLSEHFVLAWIAVFLAVVIPSFAVMLANAVDTRQGPTSAPRSPTRGLGPAPEPSPSHDRRPVGEVISGTVVSGPPPRDPGPPSSTGSTPPS